MLRRSDSIKNYFKRSFKIIFVTLTSLILAFFPGALIVAADSEDTPRPGINKANEKNNVKPGWNNKHSNTEIDWEEIQGGSSGPGGDGEKDGSGGHTSNPPGGEEGGTGDDTSTPPGDNEGGTGDDTSNPGGEEGDIGDDTSNPGGGEGGTGDGTTSNSDGSDPGGFNNGTSSIPGWDSINGKYTPLNGIYPISPYGPGNGSYNGMPFPSGAGALGIFSPYGPGYNGINNLSNLNKFASSNGSKAKLRERETIWDEIGDGVSILDTQLGVISAFEDVLKDATESNAISFTSALIKAPLSIANTVFDNDVLDVSNDVVGLGVDVLKDSYGLVNTFKESYSFNKGASVFSKMGTIGKEGFKHLGKMGVNFGDKVSMSWNSLSKANGFLGKTKNVASGSGKLLGKVWNSGVKKFKGLGFFGKVATPVAAVGSVFDGVNAIKDFSNGNYKGFAESATSSLGGMLTAAAPFTGPAAPIIGGIGLGLSAVSLGIKHWDKISAAGRAVGRGIANAGRAVGRGVSKAYNGTKKAVSNAYNATTKAVGNAAKTVGKAASKAADKVGNAAKGLVKGIGSIFG